MQPTMKLRWNKVDSLFKGELHIVNSYGEKYVLQQWFNSDYANEDGEWIDIPIEVEE